MATTQTAESPRTLRRRRSQAETFQGEQHDVNPHARAAPSPAPRSLRMTSTAMRGAMGQSWPTRSIQTISPFTAGNANDIVARIVLDQVSDADRPVLRDREPAGRRRHARRRRGRQGRSGRLHGAAAVVVAGVARRAAQDAALRSDARFRAGGPVRRPAERAGRRAVEGLEDRRRSRRRRQGQARRAELCLRRRRLGLAHAPPSACGSPPTSRSSTFRSAARSRRSPR